MSSAIDYLKLEQEAQLMLRNLRDAISSGARKSQLVGRRTAVSYAEGVLTYRQAGESQNSAIALRYQTENL